MADEPKKEPVGLAGLLSAKEGWLKIGLVLVVLSGGGNILATKEGTATNSAEIAQAIKEVHDIHDVLAESIARQKEILSRLPASPTPTPSPTPKQL
jgi:hypothetical protein